ncbi:MAG: hypothetical protein PSX80_05675 [bacterium]|nr:hypothetical protein [bacterium]
MPYKKIISSGAVKAELDGAEFFWNIRDRVGYGYRNDRNDVLLVQFLLNRAIKFWNDKLPSESVGLLEPDGLFGGQTWNRIKWFQAQTKDSESMADGMISPVDGRQLLSPKSKQIYTMYTLNKMYRHIHRLYWDDLSKDPACPPALRVHFMMTLPTGIGQTGHYGGGMGAGKVSMHDLY